LVEVTMQKESYREVVACALGQEALAERRLRWDALGARAASTSSRATAACG
jgi:hypothetical protein